jgi:hypothetical protein
MIFTFDDGPFQGVRLENTGPLPHVDAKKIDGQVEVRLARIEGDREPFVLQGLINDELAWTVRVSDSPIESVRDVQLLDRTPDSLGMYGWKVHLRVVYDGGAEYAHLYLDRKGGFLFYYLGT